MRSFHFDKVDSTNEAAKRMIEAGEIAEPFFLLAREQTAGRGSRGRIWLSPRDAGIYLSVVDVPVQQPAPLTTAYTTAAGIACASAISEATGLEVRLKPVNDLYAGGGKLGGILTEAVIQSGRVNAVITGVGVNVFHADRPLPAGAAPAVCLQQLLSAEVFRRLDMEALVASTVCGILAWNRPVHEGRIDEIERARMPRTCRPSGSDARSDVDEEHDEMSGTVDWYYHRTG